MDFFRAQLEAQKDDLLSNAGETTEHLREDTSIVPDPADRATIEEHALSCALATASANCSGRSLRHWLASIQANTALRRNW